jgi:hypothetical protein
MVPTTSSRQAVKANLFLPGAWFVCCEAIGLIRLIRFSLLDGENSQGGKPALVQKSTFFHDRQQNAKSGLFLPNGVPEEGCNTTIGSRGN